jgi:hypothetical protein
MYDASYREGCAETLTIGILSERGFTGWGGECDKGISILYIHTVYKYPCMGIARLTAFVHTSIQNIGGGRKTPLLPVRVHTVGMCEVSYREEGCLETLAS